MVTVRRINANEGRLLRTMRLAALADSPGDATTTLTRMAGHDDHHWDMSASANASGPLQATFFAEPDSRDATTPRAVGMVGAYANQDGVVNVVGLWTAPGHRDSGVAPALLDAVDAWAASSGAARLRIWVVERNDFARRFYEGHGFRPTGTSMPYELDPRLVQVEMARPLSSVPVG